MRNTDNAAGTVVIPVPSRTASGWMLAVTSRRPLGSIRRKSAHAPARVGALDQRRLPTRRVDRINDDTVLAAAEYALPS